jgi:hypothetical protein
MPELNSYKGVHNKLARQRGPASAHLCVAPGCGKQAAHWALVGEPTHHGTEHLKGTGFVVRWSTDLDDYAPTCVSHNKQLDAGGTWERCLQGHIRTEVGTDPRGACTQCRKDRINKHYRENRDKINAATRERRARQMEQR